MPSSIAGLTKSAIRTFWQWSVPYKSSHRPEDKVYVAIWDLAIDNETTLGVLAEIFPDIPRQDLPSDEEEIRHLVRRRLFTLKPGAHPQRAMKMEDSDESGSDTASEMWDTDISLLQEVTEEAWMHLPVKLRYLLAAVNARHLQQKLEFMSSENFHPPAGQKGIERCVSGINKTFNMWRNGYKAAISKKERYFVNFFFIFLAFSAIYPDVAAGFLGERSYNQRSIGMRIATLWQLFYLWTFPFHCCWLLFNWSLERLLGAFVGNTVYALAAIVPVIRAAYLQSWFRIMMLVMSLCWQISVQFYSTTRDYIMRFITRRQMKGLRQQAETERNDWKAVDRTINHELMTLKTFLYRQSDEDDHIWDSEAIPMRVRTERYIQFTSCFKLGRPADQLVGLIKDDFEGIINTYEDYRHTAPVADGQFSRDNGHVEPRLPKFLLVLFDIAIFAYVSYSFYPQPFTFNTVVAYGTVVTIKQAIVACKRYQTPKSARRLFTNMSAVNIIGVLLVSTPVTVDPRVLEDNGKFIALTLAMTFATLFLAEPIAPLLLCITERGIAAWTKMTSRSASKKAATSVHSDAEDSDTTEVGEESSSEKGRSSI
ncbi:hypothetical protein VFPPC_04269 [Pochonia chlamydosporia 170]|uniref:Uncharacterized protein n=1 Tax=Pochonia chlamydosporia 170 TaxID=1380566 RepID=A0A179FRR9_METCM|nr:hypothetical protein VFPPC_04269 [Pochonia chlamydosporia 170]OAQ67948.1 hypothetical protein VFPPC_04269 [Pochonia chlamydosporia 170]